MKRFISFIVCLFGTYVLLGITARKCELTLKPLWKELQDAQERTVQFNGKWILAGTITFKKKVIDAIELQKIILLWNGPHIESLNTSLYATEINRPFFAIQDNWVSDGQWNKHTQQLIFKFDVKYTLCSITNFHLVLTVPSHLEKILKNGYFTLESCSLPSQYQNIEKESRILSFCTKTTNSTI